MTASVQPHHVRSHALPHLSHTGTPLLPRKIVPPAISTVPSLSLTRPSRDLSGADLIIPPPVLGTSSVPSRTPSPAGTGSSPAESLLNFSLPGQLAFPGDTRLRGSDFEIADRYSVAQTIDRPPISYGVPVSNIRKTRHLSINSSKRPRALSSASSRASPAHEKEESCACQLEGRSSCCTAWKDYCDTLQSHYFGLVTQLQVVHTEMIALQAELAALRTSNDYLRSLNE